MQRELCYSCPASTVDILREAHWSPTFKFVHQGANDVLGTNSQRFFRSVGYTVSTGDEYELGLC